ncbi:aldolase [Paenibacillus chartarius]|uniref:Aldolase n=1 Tax=Paenibacillus chartarius TaxID=747481 RepID=A0ABV6DKR5_9BACL
MLIISTINKTVYAGFGLLLSSEIALPELLVSDAPDLQADVNITYGDLTGIQDHVEGFVKVIDGDVYFHVPRVALYCVRGGKQIIVTPMPKSDIAQVRLYVLGSCMGALLLQRKVLPLHGSAVVINGKAYAFVGESGAGKSTLAAAFVSQGYSLISDDIIPVSWSSEGTPMVTPSYPQQKLWHSSLEGLGMEAERFVPLYEEGAKFAVPVPSSFQFSSVPLAGIFELIRGDGELERKHLVGLERFPVLQNHTYRNFLIPLLGANQWHFTVTAQILSKINLYQLRRPSEGFTAHQLVSNTLEVVQ